MPPFKYLDEKDDRQAGRTLGTGNEGVMLRELMNRLAKTLGTITLVLPVNPS